MAQTHIYIAVAAYGGSIKTACASSLVKLTRFLDKSGVSNSVGYLDINGIENTRNVFASQAYADPQYSHLLFVDADMEFSPQSAQRLRAANKDVIGACYSKRTLDVAALIEFGKTMNAAAAIARASQYCVYFSEQPKNLKVANGMCEVDGIGMGLTLISRSALDHLVKTDKLRKTVKHRYKSAGLSGPLYGFFDLLKSDELEGGEDLAFCWRFRTWCGGKVFAIIDEDIGHVGEFTYRAKLSDALVKEP